MFEPGDGLLQLLAGLLKGRAVPRRIPGAQIFQDRPEAQFSGRLGTDDERVGLALAGAGAYLEWRQ
jgi:hypothetical protein